jgi:hypothetical protein
LAAAEAAAGLAADALRAASTWGNRSRRGRWSTGVAVDREGCCDDCSGKDGDKGGKDGDDDCGGSGELRGDWTGAVGFVAGCMVAESTAEKGCKRAVSSSGEQAEALPRALRSADR